MKAVVQQARVGLAAADHWVEIGVVELTATGHHYNGRVSVNSDAEPLGRLVLRGQAGATQLWAGLLPQPNAAKLVEFPITLPGERLVFEARLLKKATATLELVWLEPADVTPIQEAPPCVR